MKQNKSFEQVMRELSAIPGVHVEAHPVDQISLDPRSVSGIKEVKMKANKWLTGMKPADTEVRTLSAYDRGFDALLAVFQQLTTPDSQLSMKYADPYTEGFTFLGKLRKKDNGRIGLCLDCHDSEYLGKAQRIDVVTTDEFEDELKNGMFTGKVRKVVGRNNYVARASEHEFKITCNDESSRKQLENIRDRVMKAWTKIRQGKRGPD